MFVRSLGKTKVLESSVNIQVYIPKIHLCTATGAASPVTNEILETIKSFVSGLESILGGH